MKLVPPKKIRIFDYTTFSSALLLETKGLEISFREEFISTEMLFELESILAWCTTHTEVKSILFTSFGDNFLQGFNYEEFKNYDAEKIQKLNSKLHTIIQSLTYLPQTIVVDMKNSSKNEGLTISLAADIRFAKPEAKFKFDELTHGLMNASGLFSVVSDKINKTVLRALTLSGIEFGISEINDLGGYTFTNGELESVLKNINQQASVARVQTKCAHIGLVDETKKAQEFMQKLLNATLEANDYKKEKEFISLREYKGEKFEESTVN